MQRLFEGGVYSRVVFIRGNTVLCVHSWQVDTPSGLGPSQTPVIDSDTGQRQEEQHNSQVGFEPMGESSTTELPKAVQLAKFTSTCIGTAKTDI